MEKTSEEGKEEVKSENRRKKRRSNSRKKKNFVDAFKSITINPIEAPTFDPFLDRCANDNTTISPLVLTSNNGITGTRKSSRIKNTQTKKRKTYTKTWKCQ